MYGDDCDCGGECPDCMGGLGLVALPGSSNVPMDKPWWERVLETGEDIFRDITRPSPGPGSTFPGMTPPIFPPVTRYPDIYASPVTPGAPSLFSSSTNWMPYLLGGLGLMLLLRSRR